LLPSSIVEILRRSLAKRPEDRFADASQMAAALERVAAAELAANPQVEPADEATATMTMTNATAVTEQTRRTAIAATTVLAVAPGWSAAPTQETHPSAALVGQQRQAQPAQPSVTLLSDAQANREERGRRFPFAPRRCSSRSLALCDRCLCGHQRLAQSPWRSRRNACGRRCDDAGADSHGHSYIHALDLWRNAGEYQTAAGGDRCHPTTTGNRNCHPDLAGRANCKHCTGARATCADDAFTNGATKCNSQSGATPAQP
jgi:hypothetical protein